MKTELSKHKLKDKIVECFCFYPPLVPPLTYSFKKLELVEVVEPAY